MVLTQVSSTSNHKYLNWLKLISWLKLIHKIDLQFTNIQLDIT